MDALIDVDHRAEEAGDTEAAVEGFIPDAEHVVSGSRNGPGQPLTLSHVRAPSVN